MLERHNVIQTNTLPVIVLCDDLNYYYCKHHNGIGTANRLIREFIVARFLQIWESPVPDFAFVNVSQDHLPPDLGIRYRNFSVPCFGMKKASDAVDINGLVDELSPNMKQKVSCKEELIKLAFFDIWTSNEDRKFNNYNLLLQFNDNEYKFIPIDHEMCFNSGNLDRGLYNITFDESLIATPLFFKLFKNSDLVEELLVQLKAKYYLYMLTCSENVERILDDIPPEWLMNRNEMLNNLQENLLNDFWFEDCWQTLETFIETFSNI